MNKGCFLSYIQIAQLGRHHNIQLDADSSRELYGLDPISYRVALLLSIVFSIRKESFFREELARFGWNVSEDGYVHDGLSHHFSWDNHRYVQSMWADQREFSITVCVGLNGALLGWIRERAIRHPELLHAVLQEPTCQFRFSLIMDSLFMTASCAFSDIQLGAMVLPFSERPDWIASLLDHLTGLFCFAHQLPAATHAKEALLSIEHHDNYVGFCASLQQFGSVRVVDNGEKPILLLNQDPVEMYGTTMQQALQQAAGLYLSSASVVCIEGDLLCVEPNDVQLWKISNNGALLGTTQEKKPLSWESKR